MIRKIWPLLKNSISGFIADAALSHAAAIAYFTIFAIGPLLIIVIAVAGLVFGADAVRHAIVDQFSGLMGSKSGEAVQTVIQGADAGHNAKSVWATILGIGALLVTASGAFSEIQSTLNLIWKAEPKSDLSRLLRARIASLGLVLTLGFLMMVSLAVSAALSALGQFINAAFPIAHVVLPVLDVVISVLLLATVFAAIFKFLPDVDIRWSDVVVGALGTALLFTIGKSLIGLYIGKSHIGASYGAAGALIIVLVWIYYSALIFLFGAEFTRAYAELHGSHAEKTNDATGRQQLGYRGAGGGVVRPMQQRSVGPDNNTRKGPGMLGAAGRVLMRAFASQHE